MLELVAACGLLGVFALSSIRFGALRSAIYLFLVVSMLAPRNLLEWQLPNDMGYDTDIAAGAGPAVMTHSVIMLVAAACLVMARGVRSVGLYGPMFVAYMLIWTLAVWEPNLRVAGGVFYLVTCVCAWIVGRNFAQEVKYDPIASRQLVYVVAALGVIEMVICIVQIVTGHVDGNSRPAGTYDHSGVLGKNCVVLLLFLLPASWSSDRRTRWVTWTGIVAVSAATILTGSRANTIAVVSVLAVWTILLPRYQLSMPKKSIIFGVLGLAALAVAPKILERFSEDPEGGYRPELNAAGMRIFNQMPWVGTGPNNYAEVASRTEPIVQQTGYPMHNSFMLPLIELGILGGLLFLGIYLIPLLRSLACMSFAGGTRAADYGRAYVAVLAGLLIIGLTGWGLLGRNTLLLLIFALGYISVLSTRRTESTTQGRIRLAEGVFR